MSEENNTQNEQPQSRMTLNNVAKKMSGGNKTAGIVIAICMVVLGILIFVAPIIMGLGFAYIVTIGFIVYGVFQIIAYVRTPSDYRNGWTLANGIIFTLLGILILVEALGSKFGQYNMISTFAFIIGFLHYSAVLRKFRLMAHSKNPGNPEQAGSSQAASST